MSPLKRLCVYCGSRSGNDEIYTQTAHQLGMAMAQHNIGLVFGGSYVGLMREIMDTVRQHHQEVIGVIPEMFSGRVKDIKLYTELHIVADMHQRKKMMFDIADGFIAMPGGYGMLEELVEMVCWVNIGLHQKPIGLLNLNGYFDPLITMFQRTIEAGFSPPEPFAALKISSNPNELIEMMQNHQIGDGLGS